MSKPAVHKPTGAHDHDGHRRARKAPPRNPLEALSALRFALFQTRNGFRRCLACSVWMGSGGGLARWPAFKFQIGVDGPTLGPRRAAGRLELHAFEIWLV